MEIFAVIMAGGVGSRFWPRSKERTPKQLLSIFNKNSMIQDTVARLEGLIKNENILVITNKIQKPQIAEQLLQIPQENIIEEPFGRNTAACIGLASIIVDRRCKDAVTVVLPADHIILEKDKFQAVILNACNFADESRGLVTIGIPPTRPETGYGYIQIDETTEAENIHKVLTFAEKPNYSTAVRFVQSGDFLWNSGMFIWRTDAILKEIKLFMPDLYEGLEEIAAYIGTNSFDYKLNNVYGMLKSISIDYGIMEKTSKVYLTKANFSWSDVGSWEEVYLLSDKTEEGNAITGQVFVDNTVDSYIYSPNKFAAVIGMENVIVINTDTSLLICRRDQAQDVKKVVDYLKLNKINDQI